jgi:hypothetical protein
MRQLSLASNAFFNSICAVFCAAVLPPPQRLQQSRLKQPQPSLLACDSCQLSRLALRATR